MNRAGSSARTLFAAMLVVGLVSACGHQNRHPSFSSGNNRQGAEEILKAFRDRRSNVIIEGAGVVERTLSDDTHFPRHQRFVLRVGTRHTVLVAHNIDLAPRVPLHEGDSVGFRGEYEWNDKGGLVHWTHDDPEGKHAGGWLDVGGRRYR